MSEERAGPDPGDEQQDLDLEEFEADESEEPEEGESEAEPEEQPEQPEEQQQQRPASREQRRIQSLRQRLRAQEDENRRLRENHERFLLQQRQPQQPAIDPVRQAQLEREELERVSMLAPHEQVQYHTRKTEERLLAQFQRQQFETRDLLDQDAFSRLQREEPAARRLAGEVEQVLATARQNGMNPTREAIYNLLLGQEVRSSSKRQAETQRRRGQSRIASQQTRPAGMKSTAGSPSDRRSRNADADDEALLSGITLGEFLNSNG